MVNEGWGAQVSTLLRIINLRNLKLSSERTAGQCFQKLGLNESAILKIFNLCFHPQALDGFAPKLGKVKRLAGATGVV
jgi:hypothetical protein